jgi:hypothetical protein
VGEGERIASRRCSVLLVIFWESFMRLVRFALIFAVGLYIGFQIGGKGLEGAVNSVRSFVERLEGRR